MNIESVRTLFSLFSGENETEALMPFVTLAMAEMEKMLSENADITDVRLEFLCAAQANYRYCQANAARDDSVNTYGGKLAKYSDKSSALRYAELLLADYMNMCGDLIKPKTFMFMSFGGETEGLENA